MGTATRDDLVWDSFRGEIHDAWQGGDAEELQDWRDWLSRQIARGDDPNIAALCHEYVTAAYEMTLYEPEAGLMWDAKSTTFLAVVAGELADETPGGPFSRIEDDALTQARKNLHATEQFGGMRAVLA